MTAPVPPVDLDQLDAYYEPKAREYGSFYIDREDYRALIAELRDRRAKVAAVRAMCTRQNDWRNRHLPDGPSQLDVARVLAVLDGGS